MLLVVPSLVLLVLTGWFSLQVSLLGLKQREPSGSMLLIHQLYPLGDLEKSLNGQGSVSVRKVGFSCSSTSEHLDKPRGSRIAHRDAGRILNYRERRVV